MNAASYARTRRAARSQMAAGWVRLLAGDRVDWEVADPAGRDIVRVRAIRDGIGVRVRAPLAELGVDGPAPAA